MLSPSYTGLFDASLTCIQVFFNAGLRSYCLNTKRF